MDKRFRMAYLMDIYGELLTEKQREVLGRYLEEDYSLTEIASLMGVSRQAAFDLIKRTEKLLEEYDGALGLFGRYMENVSRLENLKKLCSENQEALSLIEELIKNI